MDGLIDDSLGANNVDGVETINYNYTYRGDCMTGVPEVKLKVAEAIQDDVTKGIVRIDSGYMKQIGVRSGDIVEIQGGRKTVAIVDRAYPGDMGLNIIRMDGLIRRNGKTGIGEVVIVRKANVKEAKKVMIAPAKEGIVIRANPIIFKQGLLGRAVVKGDIVSLGGTRTRRSAMSQSPFFDDIFNIVGDEALMGFGLGDLKFMIVDVTPAKEAVIITDATEVVFNPEAVPEQKDDGFSDIVSYEDIGGLEEEIKKVREMVELPLKHPEIFDRLGIEPPKGVLLHGPPGTGKTLLARAVAAETHVNFVMINGPEIMSKFYGESEANLRKIFKEAEEKGPSIIFFDEIDAIAIKREETHGEVEKRVVAQLLAIMDGIKSRKVVVMAASNIPNALDPALRRPGRFDREIEIGVPSKNARLQILNIHTRNMQLRGSWYTDVACKEMLSKLDFKLKEGNLDRDKLNSELSKLKKSKDTDSILLTLKNKLKGVDSKIKRLEELKKLFDYREKLVSVLEHYKEIAHSKEIWDSDDPRKKFLEINENKLDSEVKDVLSDLIELDLLSKSFYSEVTQKGIPEDLKSIAEITYGFVGADLASLCKESAIGVLRRYVPDMNLQSEDPIPEELLEKLYITRDDFMSALRIVRPSALREVLIDKPNTKWDDVGGLEEVKQKLREAVEWPLKNRERFTTFGIRPPLGVLLYGPPGTGKTLLAKAVATESGANFILVNGPELISKWVGDSEKAVRKIFEKARQASPSIIFFDEIDSLVPKRGANQDSSGTNEKIVNQLLTEMNGLEELKDVVVIGATNRPDLIDSAFLRPGRFDRVLLVAVPDLQSRTEIFHVHLKHLPIDFSGLDKNIKIPSEIMDILVKKFYSKDALPLDKETKLTKKKSDILDRDKLAYYLALKSEGYVGADVESVCREAAMITLRNDINAKEVSIERFLEALKEVKPSSSKDIEAMYAQFSENFRKTRAEEMKDKPTYYG